MKIQFPFDAMSLYPSPNDVKCSHCGFKLGESKKSIVRLFILHDGKPGEGETYFTDAFCFTEMLYDLVTNNSEFHVKSLGKCEGWEVFQTL